SLSLEGEGWGEGASGTSPLPGAESPHPYPPPQGGRGPEVHRGHGEVSVTYLATIFKKIKLHTHENIGWGKIGLPQDDLHTGAFWIALPSEVTIAASKSTIEAALEGVGQVLVNVAPLLLMCDPGDLHLSTQTKSP